MKGTNTRRTQANGTKPEDCKESEMQTHGTFLECISLKWELGGGGKPQDTDAIDVGIYSGKPKIQYSWAWT